MPSAEREPMTIDHIRCPLHRYTFSKEPIRKWVEGACEPLVLNLFAGKTLLSCEEVRNDVDASMVARYRLDALDFVRQWRGEKFGTVLLDPPYSYRKSMEKYNKNVASRFRLLKDELPQIIKPSGIVITFGYHSVSMGSLRGFAVERIGLFSHGGAIHDTISTVERMMAPSTP